MDTSFEKVNSMYELEIDRVVDTISKKKVGKVLLQFPEGMKPYAQAILDVVSEKCGGKVECFIWLGDCFGACDLPIEVERMGVDLIVQFGHSNWGYSNGEGVSAC